MRPSSPKTSNYTHIMKASIITIILLAMGWTAFAQPNRQQLAAYDDLNKWVTDPPHTIMLTNPKGGSTTRNAYGTIIDTDEYGTLFITPRYFLTDRYSTYAQKFGPQTYIIATYGDAGILYSVKDNRINPNCAKEFDWKLMPRLGLNVPYEYGFKTPINYYRLNEQGKRVLKKDKFPEIIQKLFKDFPEYYEKYSIHCKEMNFNDPYYVSLLIEALIRYDKSGFLTKLTGNVLTFCAAGFKACSGSTSFRVLEYAASGNVSPLEPVIPASRENDEITYYEKDKRSYSKNYLNQVESISTIPQDYSNVQFDGEPCLLTDLYGFPAVFDNSRMYYLK